MEFDHEKLTLPSRKSTDVQPEELSEGNLICINEESACDKKDEDVREEVMPTKNFTLKKFSEIFHEVESTKKKNVGS